MHNGPFIYSRTCPREVQRSSHCLSFQSVRRVQYLSPSLSYFETLINFLVFAAVEALYIRELLESFLLVIFLANNQNVLNFSQTSIP